MKVLLLTLLGGLGLGLGSCGQIPASLERTISTGRDGAVVVSTPDGAITKYGIATGSLLVVPNLDGSCTTIERDGKAKPRVTTGPCP